ncbi:protein translocase subunit SecD [Chamaesiphon minutus]|uniref:Protein translocase subunit SecD n=1 Tax=Chamaesiphon minutus (strain ATCC 27169 / PCC 6605) TaxID=1173020 RepID=K9UL59_CHAP6|nr:protein translocase subunit SecD [Chamaesiphon minutus]AFY94929.1 protein-export membrane protein, SecD/SecF family [Chamaesiphon minutus PCC 6605]
MQKQRVILGLILVLVIAAITLLVNKPMRLGLDLQGGSQLTIQVKPTKERPTISENDINAVQRVIENRINGLGVSEALIQSAGNNQILVQLPGVNDPQQAERVLGGTAQLEFREQKAGTETQLGVELTVLKDAKDKQAAFKKSKSTDKAAISENQATIEKAQAEISKLFNPAAITGKQLTGANPSPVGAGSWEVAIEFDSTGGDAFAKLTKNLAGTGRAIGVFLDNDPISTPTVGPQFAATGITGGKAVITGNFTTEAANDLAVQLRGGSLPVPVEIVENRTVGATLGRDSIQSSIYAGIGGLILVAIFMGVYYRLPGIVADIALVIYTIISLAAFNILDVTLTLPGIAGFILSIGMAIDANVLIFERTREELQTGKTLYKSVEAGFHRAFDSIWDGQVTTLISCGALFFLGSGLVKGYAVTLGVGVAISLFTSVTCTRTFLLLLVLGFPVLRQKTQFFAPNVPKLVTK